MWISFWFWLNAHPEYWVPGAGALVSLAADAVKERWPAAGRVVDALVHLVPNLPGAYRTLRGKRCCREPKKCDRREGEP